MNNPPPEFESAEEEEEWYRRRREAEGEEEEEDECPEDPNKTHPGECGCGVEEDTGDDDDDGMINCLDSCPSNAERQDGECPCEFNKVRWIADSFDVVGLTSV